MVSDLVDIQDCISNKLNEEVESVSYFVGIVGDRPSQSAKSPTIWNPTLKKFKFDALYVAFDVEEGNLSDLLQALRVHPQLMGFNVTVPYKVKILPLLDELESKAERIGAVNTVVREPEGRLVGYNTDGQGGIDSLTQVQPGEKNVFISSLKGAKTLLIGSGGAAAALAHYINESSEGAALTIANRTEETAKLLAESVNKAGGLATGVSETEIENIAPEVGLIVNATVKGQSGIRQLADGAATCMEPYSSLALAEPETVSRLTSDNENQFYSDWWKNSMESVVENQRKSSEIVSIIPSGVRFYDSIYSPEETVFLRHGRLSGHQIMNGKGMNVCQAADGFFNRIMSRYLQEQNLMNGEVYKAIRDFMYQVW